MQKKILEITHPRHSHWVGDGFYVSQYIPGYGKNMSAESSPFLMLDYNAPYDLPPQKNGHRPGVGYHPHRGFETVTLVYAGNVEHQDTAGNGGVIGPDDVQWMTAGSGLLHNEFFTEEFSRNGGTAHFVQLWVNLPKEFKMVKPRYQFFLKKDIPTMRFDGGVVRIISGELSLRLSSGENLEGKGAALTYSRVDLYDIITSKGQDLSFAFPEGFTLKMLVIEGSMKIEEKEALTGDMMTLSRNGDNILIQTSGKTRILLMAGEPFDDPVVNYGPFVMNSHEEIMEAFRDLESGKMGKI